ncbi:hypothetical protein BCR43DRAFT_486721 [Syncephalastrum racemosum]|uniref:F-box/LRR-repeat protein 15-like leucin rich repeat domain-containing protein n=1 Tax=Syncephalastrum racemosum TaxID=13706 RepID=A0A1X2HPR8_SYNRA|nr:hypothetical protein BCR43DRAFT_486721 [Syncephalastrum racemosum]
MAANANNAPIKAFDPMLFITPIPAPNLYSCLEIVIPGLAWKDQASCALVDHKVYNIVRWHWWTTPDFTGYLHDRLYVANKLVKLLPSLGPQTRKLIRHIDLSELDEGLYDRIDPHLFDSFIKYMPRLETLNISKTAFLDSLPSHHWELPYLRSLDISYCDHMTDGLLVKIARGLPHLTLLRMDNIAGGGGKRALAGFADSCSELASLSIRNNTLVDDAAVTALAKFTTIHLRELDLTGCVNVSEEAFSTMARHNVNLRYLSLAHTRVTTDDLIPFLIGRAGRFLKHLDIGFCNSVDPQRLASYLLQAKDLKLLAISMPIAVALCQHQQIIHVDELATVDFLVVHELSENTPMAFLDDLRRIFPGVKRVTLTRDYYEADFMSFGSEKPKQAVITEDALNRYNMEQSSVIVTLANDRDKIEGLSIHFW